LSPGKPILYCAPIRGVTDYIFRNIFEKYFGRFDFLLTPFIPTVRGRIINPSHLRDVQKEHNDLSRVIPQIIGNNASQFIVLAKTLHDIGYLSVNWNLGCPSPQITRKKRGCGLLPHPDILRSFLDIVMKAPPCPLSLKVRLGFENDHELESLIPLFNQYPFHEVIIHARTGVQIYDGRVNLDIFEQCVESFKHPVIYNGDITTPDFFESLRTRFSSVNRWMIGRGIVSNPFLLEELQAGTCQFDKKRIQQFHDELYTQNSTILSGPAHLLGKMKELWSYLASSFPEDPKLLKKILRTTTLRHYSQIITKLFS